MRFLVMASLVVGVVAVGCADGTSATGGTGGAGAGGGSGGSGGGEGMVWPCTEAGIRDAIAAGGGPHRFACDGPTTVTTEATIEIDNDVWLDGEGNLAVDGNRDHRVFMVSPSAESTLWGMTITHGHAEVLGGGIYSLGSLFIQDSEIVENTAGDLGGGVYSLDGDLTLWNTVVARNEATRGGGMFVGGMVEVTDSTIVENVGGGIDSGWILIVRDSTITGNTTERGGGGVNNSGDAFFSGTLIADNDALLGGGIANAGYLFLSTTTLVGNTADEGGAIYGFDAIRSVPGGELEIFDLGWIDMHYSTVSNNTARIGGGIYSISLRMTTFNSTLSGNDATEAGGALYIGGTTLGASTTHLSANTIVDNTAPAGSAVFSTGETPTIRFSGNIVVGDCTIEPIAIFASDGSNIESPGDTCGFFAPGDQVDVTSGALNLGPLADNGGDTNTHLPMAGSVAIDAIPIDQCGVVLPIIPLLDQRTVMRPQGSGCDIGSVEVE